MKKSEELRDESRKEDNDFRAMALYKKSMREKRSEVFEEKYLDRIKTAGYVLIDQSEGKYTFDTGDLFGIVDYFPKASRLLIRKDNQWVDFGLNWIEKHLLNGK